jgi:hypothetical protein
MRALSRVLGFGAAGLILLGALATTNARVAAQPTQPIYVQYDDYVKNKDGTLTSPRRHHRPRRRRRRQRQCRSKCRS